MLAKLQEQEAASTLGPSARQRSDSASVHVTRWRVSVGPAGRANADLRHLSCAALPAPVSGAACC